MVDFQNFTAIIEKDDNIYTSLCPEFNIAGQGTNIDEAKQNLREAIELFFETVSTTEILTRTKRDIYITNITVSKYL